MDNSTENNKQSVNAKVGRRERRHLSEYVQIEEELLPGFVKPIMLLIGLAVLAFLIWAGITRVTEIAVATGEVIPSGAIKVVQHLDGGIVADINVSSRDRVNKGDVLLRLDGSKAKADLKQMQARMAALQLESERLIAITENRAVDFSGVDNQYADLVEGQRRIYDSQLATLNSSLDIISRQIKQRQTRLVQLEKNLQTARKQQKLTSQLLEVRAELAERKLIDLTTLIETERADNTAKEEISRLREEIHLVNEELAEVQSRYQDTENQIRQDSLKELGKVRSEKAEVAESLAKLQAQVERLEIRSPVEGYIHNMSVQTVGQVITPGEILMQVVPDNVQLKAKVRIHPKDIGYVRVGQDVNVRVSSYDFTLYGVASGEVEQVSASNLIDEDGQSYFEGIVSFAKPYVGDEEGRYPLQAGMAVDADILTGEKTLLTYLLKPIVVSLNRAFSER
ncbi:MAG: HlyD family type I secretion periplasmic adaptor subunit [Gammaproteobacteria bacterium]|jgi:membrane fusion protein, adhesin transport system